MDTIERRDVASLKGPWHPVLRAYAAAIGVMRELPPDDVRSLAYQASVHGVGAETDPPPDSFRSQCQHNCWYFLPWHRWYLHYFEGVVRSLLTEIDEVPDDVAASWALPYWNYAVPGAEKLPPELASPTRWDGRDNPLFDGTRLPAVNARTAALDPRQTVPGAGVLGQTFSSAAANVATFGGTASGWQHFREGGAVAGGLELTPHNAVHGFVGGDMWRFATAGLDPVFWLHHCTIDRYWEVRGHAADPSGWAGVVFDFRTVDGPVRVDSDGCVDTVGQLGYRYDDVTPPPAPTAGQEVRARRLALMVEEPAPELPPEVVGRRGAVPLEGRRADAPMQVGGASDQFWTARRGAREPRRVFLTLEDVTGDANPGISYAVYVGRSGDDTRMAGLISFFGIEGSRGAGHPLGFAFDVTDIVRAMRDEEAWDPDDLHVIFEPVWPVHDDASSAVGDVAPVEVGTISVVYQ